MSAGARLDVRIPIGLMFTGDGLLLTIYGAVAKPADTIANRLVGNVNLWWGAVVLAFGLSMLTWAFVSRQKAGPAA